jgi:hypothetical protein
VQGLLRKDRTIRLGAGGDSAQILSHPWLSDMDVRALEAYEVTPPFRPELDEYKPN